MLPALARMRRGAEYAATVRRGHRASSRAVTVHIVGAAEPEISRSDGTQPPRVGFVVSRAVGPAVVRNRVRRRLRHLMRDRLALLPDGSAVVIRAHASAAQMPPVLLAAELDRALERALMHAGSGTAP